MTSGELLSLFRTEMFDSERPYLWSDEEVYGYIDDAQKMFCRKTDGIADATTAGVVALNITPGTTWVPLHPGIKLIRRASRVDTGRPVEILNEQDMADRGWYWDGAAGALRALIIGEEADKARVFPDSSETVTVRLLVYRMPIDAIADDQPFEISERHHRHLLLWVQALAYMKQDAETLNKTKSNEFENKFYAYCADSLVEARREKHKTRIVRYGG